MIPLIPTLALAFLSFFSSVFVILHAVIPILPPHPLKGRIALKRIGPSKSRTLSPADKVHVWLALCDLLALVFFSWEVVEESLGGPSDRSVASDPASSVRLWVSLTVRQTCLLVVAAATLIYVRKGKPISFGAKQWTIWVPTLVIAVTSAALAGVMAEAGEKSLFFGVLGFSVAVAVLSTAAFTSLVATLLAIRRNLASPSESTGVLHPAVEEKLHGPYAASDGIKALKDGDSWITSNASSRRNSISSFSFSTTHSALTHDTARAPNPNLALCLSTPDKLPCMPFSCISAHDAEESEKIHPSAQISRMSSKSSWLTEPDVSYPTMTAWSFPTTCVGSPMPASSTALAHGQLPDGQEGSCPITPAMSSTQVLGESRFLSTTASLSNAEKGINGLSWPYAKCLDVSVWRVIAWLALIWIPLGFSVPYLIIVSLNEHFTNIAATIFLILSVTLSAPLLAVNVLFSPIPIPSGLFETRSESSIIVPPSGNLPSPRELGSRYTRSGSVTVVESRRSGDVWLSKGDAIDGKNKLRRAMTMVSPAPKLSVLPSCSDSTTVRDTTPQLSQHDVSLPPTIKALQSGNCAEMERRLEIERDNTYASTTADSLAATIHIMTAKRQYPALAETMFDPPVPDGYDITSAQSSHDRESDDEAPSAAEDLTPRPIARTSTHHRSCSAPTLDDPVVNRSGSYIRPPLASRPPLTPPRELLDEGHKYQEAAFSGPSSNVYSSVNGIDSLSAKVLPLLLPGLTIGPDTKVEDSPTRMPSFTSSVSLSSPEQASTPVRAPQKRPFAFRRHHGSLPPSLGLKNDIHSSDSCDEDLARDLVGTGAQSDHEDVTIRGEISLPSASLDVKSPEESRLLTPTYMTRSGTIPSSNNRPRASAHPYRRPSGLPVRTANRACSSMTTLIATQEPSHPASSQLSLMTAVDGFHSMSRHTDIPRALTSGNDTIYEQGFEKIASDVVLKATDTTGSTNLPKFMGEHTGLSTQHKVFQQRDSNIPRWGGKNSTQDPKKWHGQNENVFETMRCELARSTSGKAQKLLRQDNPSVEDTSGIHAFR